MPVPKRDKRRLRQLYKMLRSRPTDITEICEKFCIGERTAYRWIGYVEEAYIGTVVKTPKGFLMLEDL